VTAAAATAREGDRELVLLDSHSLELLTTAGARLGLGRCRAAVLGLASRDAQSGPFAGAAPEAPHFPPRLPPLDAGDVRL
jgi:hypothetical protein